MSQSEKLLHDLKEMEEKLQKIKKFLNSTKTGNLGDSLFTPENIEAFIAVLEADAVPDKYMIQTLKSLLPLARKSDEEIKKETQKTPLPKLPSENYNACTPKLRSKISFNKLI